MNESAIMQKLIQVGQMLERGEINSTVAETDTKHYLEQYVSQQKPNENINDEIKNIKEMIDLYDDNYNCYRRRYLQTESDEDRYQMNRWLKLRKEQEILLKDMLR